MNQIICIANQKGGVGKTATAVNLAASLALLEKKTLLIDCDPQSSATLWLGVDKDVYPNSLYHLLTGEKNVEQIIAYTELEMLQVMPSDFELINILTDSASETLDENIFVDKISVLKDRYEYIIIDTPPSINRLTFCALATANQLVIPIQCIPHAIESLGLLLENVRDIQKNINSALKIGGILFTFCKNYDEAVRYFSNQTLDSFGNLIFPTTIPHDNLLQDSFGIGKPVVLFDIESKGAKAYLDMAFDLDGRCH